MGYYVQVSHPPLNWSQSENAAPWLPLSIYPRARLAAERLPHRHHSRTWRPALSFILVQFDLFFLFVSQLARSYYRTPIFRCPDSVFIDRVLTPLPPPSWTALDFLDKPLL